MPFTEKAKLTALAIVQIFETGKPFGDYSAVAVLNDGAGISYGIKQFTHKSGSLYAVVQRFVKLGGQLPPIINSILGHLKDKDHIAPVANNKQVRDAFKALGKDSRMQKAQREIAFAKYLNPAIEACEGSDFVLPLSLAVVYDSKIHGSFDKIRDRVVVERPGNGSMKEEEYEREWITRYVRKRDAWLESIPRLAATDYRTDFFLAQIARGNWELALPVTVQGVRLTNEMVNTIGDTFADLSDNEVEEFLDIEEETLSDLHSPANGTAGNSPSIEPQATTQIAENIVNAPAPEPPFVPETLVMKTPQKDGATSATTKTAILGIAVPAGVYAVFQGIQEWIEKGFIDVKEVIAVLLGLIRENVRYISIFAGLIVGVVIVKKIFKQITFIVQMLINANPRWHNVELKTPEPEVKTSWWKFW